MLVVDDVHRLHESVASIALNALASDLPPQAKLVIGSRRPPPLPIARMRAEDGVTEIGSRELAMTRPEAASLLKTAGHDVGRDGIDRLLAQTEGWPAALSLAARYLTERGVAALMRFGGTDRLVQQYVRDEVLCGVSADRLDFLRATSVEDMLSAPLCDALAATSGSGHTLAALAREGLAVPLDRCDEHFRYHRLLAESLRAELHATAPERERELHRRAGAWQRQAGDVDRALDHALRAGDVGDAADVVWSNLVQPAAQGRTDTVERWLDRFTSDQIAEHATLGLTAGTCALLRGQGHLANHWAATAAAAAGLGAEPMVRAWATVLQAALDCGSVRPPRDLVAGFGGEAARAAGALVTGMHRHFAGDRDGAATALEAGARQAAISAPAIHVLCLARLAELAVEEGDWDAAAALVTRSRAQLDRYALADHPAMALVLAVSALVRACRGRVDPAQSDLGEAVRLQAELIDFPPAATAEVSLIVAGAALRLSDIGVAREHLATATRILRRLPAARGLHELAADVTARLDAFTASGDAPTAMTPAELRILQHLPTHLSFREIGELTYVSANTVKTQANSVYRKLGAACRSDAVARARACGLLHGTST